MKQSIVKWLFELNAKQRECWHVVSVYWGMKLRHWKMSAVRLA